MIMNKTLLKNTFVIACLAMIFGACSPKYTASFRNSSHHIAPEKGESKKIAENSSVEKLNRTEIEAPNADELYASQNRELKHYVIPEVEELVKKYEQKAKEIESKGLAKKVERRAIRKEKKKLRKSIKKEVKEEIKMLKQQDASDDYVLMMVLAIIIPPLGVGLTYGITAEFWISLILTLIFWLPGAIYSAIVVHQHFRG